MVRLLEMLHCLAGVISRHYEPVCWPEQVTLYMKERWKCDIYPVEAVMKLTVIGGGISHTMLVQASQPEGYGSLPEGVIPW